MAAFARLLGGAYHPVRLRQGRSVVEQFLAKLQPLIVRNIREAGHNTMGVKLVDLDPGDKLQSIAPDISEQQEDAAADAPGRK